MLLEELHQLADGRELISIERDCHDTELTGYLHHVSDSLVTMFLFTNDGDFDGFTAFKFDQIDEVFWGNREHKAIHLLIDTSHDLPQIDLVGEDFSSAIMKLNASYPSLCIHSPNDEDRYDIAHIEEYGHDWCKIQTYGPKRTLSRMYKLMRTRSISRIGVEKPYQNAIVRLHSQHL